MIALNINRPWPEVKEKLIEAEPLLTDDDLHYEAGNDSALLERLASKLGRSPDHIKGWIESVAFTDVKAG